MSGKILVVDDEIHIRNVITNYLTKCGFDVKGAIDGIDAVRNCIISEFDLVLMDIQMPSLNGIDAIKALQIIYPYLEIWIVSGNALQEQEEEAKKIGIKNFFKKPVMLDKLAAKIKEFINNKEKS